LDVLGHKALLALFVADISCGAALKSILNDDGARWCWVSVTEVLSDAEIPGCACACACLSLEAERLNDTLVDAVAGGACWVAEWFAVAAATGRFVEAIDEDAVVPVEEMLEERDNWTALRAVVDLSCWYLDTVTSAVLPDAAMLLDIADDGAAAMAVAVELLAVDLVDSDDSLRLWMALNGADGVIELLPAVSGVLAVLVVLSVDALALALAFGLALGVSRTDNGKGRGNGLPLDVGGT
jgi:hypothetical protein